MKALVAAVVVFLLLGSIVVYSNYNSGSPIVEQNLNSEQKKVILNQEKVSIVVVSYDRQHTLSHVISMVKQQSKICLSAFPLISFSMEKCRSNNC
jgi:hypothetical protein